MPPIKYFEIEQSRSVQVAANNEEEALAIANRAFDGKTEGELDHWGRRIGAVEINSVNITIRNAP